MDFWLTEEQLLFVDSFRKFLAGEVAPLVERCEREHRFPPELFPKFGEMGYLGIAYPEAYGGMEMGYMTLTLFAEELGKVSSGFAGGIMAHMSIATLPIYLLGSDALKERYLRPAIRGEKIGAFGLTEPGAGSDAAAIKTRAKKVDGGYVLNGSKTFITNGPFADFVTVAAQAAPEKKYKGITLFVVEKGAKGFTQGAPFPKLGNHSSECGELFFEDCFVPDAQRLGDEGAGFHILMEALNGGRMVVGARAVGIAQAALDASVKYAQEREQFGKPLFQFQLTQAKLARMRMEIEASRLLCQRAAWLRDQRRPCALEASLAKLKATETAVYVTGEAVQIFGGYGYMEEYPVERYFRDAKAMTIIEGATEIQQIIIARHLAG
jgi:acyl-CoA dehydrogenase